MQLAQQNCNVKLEKERELEQTVAKYDHSPAQTIQETARKMKDIMNRLGLTYMYLHVCIAN